MKRLFYLCILIGSIFISQTAWAQDIIIKRNADEIEAIVKEIGINTVTYKRYSNPNGPDYTISKSEIFMIKYANGEKEVFTTSKSNTANIQVSDKPRALRQYRLLDLYDENGVRGIVVKVYDNGYHGTIMSLEQNRLAFMKYIEAFSATALGLYNTDNGMENQKQLLDYLSQRSLLTIDDFPAMKWCISLGEGWYLPARNEMGNILAHISLDKDISLETLNQTIRSYKGEKLETWDSYVTSTESKTEGNRINAILVSNYFINYSESTWYQWRWTPAFVRAFYQF